jgi:TRAP-type C4-dicarboxylate transport system substrate-binding protein
LLHKNNNNNINLRGIKMIKKIVLIVGILFISSFLVLAEGKPITLRFASTATPGMGVYESETWFCEQVKERTKGAVVVEYYPNSQLGDDLATIRGCLSGSIDIGNTSGANLSQFSKALVFPTLPGLLKDTDHARRVYNDPYIRNWIVETMYNESELTPIMIQHAGWPREIGNTKRPVYTPDDLKGLRIRTTSSAIEVAVLEAWGAIPVKIAWTEVYSALQQGVADGVYVSQMWAATQKFHEVYKAFTLARQSWTVMCQFLGQPAVEKLGPKYLEIVKEVARETELMEDELTIQTQLDTIKMFEDDYGIEICRPTEEQLEMWNAKSRTIWDQFVGEYPEKPVSEQIVNAVNELR